MDIFSKLTGDKQLHKLTGADTQGDYRALSESQPSTSLSVDFLWVVQYCNKTDNCATEGTFTTSTDGIKIRY